MQCFPRVSCSLWFIYLKCFPYLRSREWKRESSGSGFYVLFSLIALGIRCPRVGLEKMFCEVIKSEVYGGASDNGNMQRCRKYNKSCRFNTKKPLKDALLLYENNIRDNSILPVLRTLPLSLFPLCTDYSGPNL